MNAMECFAKIASKIGLNKTPGKVPFVPRRQRLFAVIEKNENIGTIEN